MSSVKKNKEVTCRMSDIDFKVFFDHNEENNDVSITSIYLIGKPEVDLIDVIDSEVKEDLEQDIEDEFNE